MNRHRCALCMFCAVCGTVVGVLWYLGAAALNGLFRPPKIRCVLAAAILGTLCMGARLQDAPSPLRGVGIDQKLGASVPLGLVFKDEHGRGVRLRTLITTRPVVLALVYYRCPMLCVQVLDGLAAAIRPLSLAPGRDFDVVVVSIDPAERVEVSPARRRQLGAEAWHFLSGDSTSIRYLADAVGFRFRFEPSTRQFAHAAGIMVLTPGGVVARYLYGIEYAPRDLRLALVEASEGRVGTAVDRITLLCLAYDPASGRYGLAVMGSVRVLAVLTFLALALFVIRSVRRERRRR